VRRGVALTVGAAIPLIAIAAVVLLTLHASGAADGGSKHSATGGVIDLVAAAALAYLALRALQPTRTAQEQQAARAERAPGGPGRYVALGAGVMLVNFSTLALFVPAVKDIGRADDVSAEGEVAVLVLLLVIVLVPAWVPVALRAAFPARSRRLLKPLGRWMHDHQRALGGAVSAVFAAYLFVRGVLVLR
jgi:threonine/homoserine/homoserine lactone efflux protein